MTKKEAVAARTAAVTRRTFSREFKLKVIREVEAGKSQAQVAREYQITENTISKWRRQHRQYQDRAFAGLGHAYTDEARLHELERMRTLVHCEHCQRDCSLQFNCTTLDHDRSNPNFPLFEAANEWDRNDWGWDGFHIWYAGDSVR